VIAEHNIERLVSQTGRLGTGVKVCGGRLHQDSCMHELACGVVKPCDSSAEPVKRDRPLRRPTAQFQHIAAHYFSEYP
jgi:hypothetical protein